MVTKLGKLTYERARKLLKNNNNEPIRETAYEWTGYAYIPHKIELSHAESASGGSLIMFYVDNAEVAGFSSDRLDILVPSGQGRLAMLSKYLPIDLHSYGLNSMPVMSDGKSAPEMVRPGSIVWLVNCLPNALVGILGTGYRLVKHYPPEGHTELLSDAQIKFVNHPKVKQEKPTGFGSVVPTLVKTLPGITNVVSHPITHIPIPIYTAIIELNDVYKWSREQIADWLETLDADLAFPIGVLDGK